MSQREPEAESVRGGKPFTRPDGRPRVPYYPPELKAHYIDLLRRVKTDLSRSTGKPVGWQTIRNMIMEPEDAAIASAEQALRRHRHATKATRTQQERDAFLTIEHLKAWDKGAALPSDPRCYFIERFLNRLRKDGQLDRVEHAATTARQRYLKDALFSLYRPDAKLSTTNGVAGRSIQKLTFDELKYSGFLIGGTLVDPAFNKADVILLFGEVENFIFDVEVLLLRRKELTSLDDTGTPPAPTEILSSNITLLFHGFLVLFQYQRENTVDGRDDAGHVSAGGALLLRNSSDSTIADLGLEGRLPSFMQCAADMYIRRDHIEVRFLAGQGLAAFASLFPTKPTSVLEPTAVEPRVTTRLSNDMVVTISGRDFARPCFG